MVSALDRKLARDLWRMKGQALAIALVISGGVATLVMSRSTMDSLRFTQSSFYAGYRFADVFVQLKRAPERLRARLFEIPGVRAVETRVAADVKLRVEGFGDPVTGRVVSAPENAGDSLNGVFIRSGRAAAPGSADEAVLGEAFAQAHGLMPGDEVEAVINGRLKKLKVVGIGLSPEYIYQLKPGTVLPDFKRYALMWMDKVALSTAYDMEGAFNDASLALSPGARLEDVIDRLDVLLGPYGGLGAYGRRDQTSHRYLSEEFGQLEQMATIFPVIFLGVSAFLLNIVVGRLIGTQREQVAALKAFGYGNLAVGVHYVKLVLVVVLFGLAGGVTAGAWLGKGLGRIYMRYYRFPYLDYVLEPEVVLVALSVCAAAAFSGTLASVWRAAKLPPAVAMRPEPPESYRRTLLERAGLGAAISEPTRMIARNIERRALKSIVASTGIAFAFSVTMVGGFFEDAVNHMIDVQFGLSELQDLRVSFNEPASRRSLYELRSLPGVERVEVTRAVPVRLVSGHRSYRTAVYGFEQGGSLRRLLNRDMEPFEVPPEGIVITDYLGEILHVAPGGRLRVEALEGKRTRAEVPVASLVSEYVGVQGYMELGYLNRLLREPLSVSGAYLSVDEQALPEIYSALNGMPRVAGVEEKKEAVRNFRETMSDQVLIFASITTALAAIIAFGVVYNSARIALSERSRELATLRVLGFTRAEANYILLGELAFLTLAAIPLGFLIGRGLCAYMIARMQTDLFRIPLVIEPGTYAFSATVVLASALVSGLIVKRRVDRLDMVLAIKAKD